MRLLNLMYFFLTLVDTPLGQVKLGEFSEWLGRRNLGVSGIAGGISRGNKNL